MKIVRDKNDYVIVYYCFITENDYKNAEKEFDNIFYNSNINVGLLPACKYCKKYDCKYNSNGEHYGTELE